MVRSTLRLAGLVAAIGVFAVAGGAAALAADAPQPQKPVALTINPDGTAVWNGEPLDSEPALQDKIARQTQQAPRLELDVRFHSVGALSDSNRQTLLDVVELAARYGYVHVQATGDGATLTVLGPSAAGAAVPK
jgi:biopolymer transport protein ExbD